MFLHILLFASLAAVGYGEIAEEDGGNQIAPPLMEKFSAEDFLQSYNYFDSYSPDDSNLQNAMLGYVTPWNGKGYDYAKEFARKFTHISPVWLQLKTTQSEYIITGQHDHDQAWIDKLKSNNPKLKFLPRILFDGWSDFDYQMFLGTEDQQLKCIQVVLDECAKRGYDGIVLEIWSQHSGTSQLELVEFIGLFGHRLHRDKLQLILVVPPPVYEGGYVGRFNKGLFDRVKNSVDYFSVMTYDYSHGPGPNSPLEWIKECVTTLVPDAQDANRKKLLMGTNFYGYHYIPSEQNTQTVMSHEFLNIVKQYRPPFLWMRAQGEHYLEYKDKEGKSHSVYYPTAFSLALRLSLISDLNVGLSIWELGQGFRCFFSQL